MRRFAALWAAALILAGCWPAGAASWWAPKTMSGTQVGTLVIAFSGAPSPVHGCFFIDRSNGFLYYSVDGATLTQVAAAAGYQPLDAGLTDISGLAVTDGNLIVGDGVNWVAESGATARTSLGLGTLATQSGTFSGTSSGTNTGDQTIVLSGDASGTGSGAITVVVTDNSHEHTTTTISALAGEDITTGTVADARIASTLARDSEVAAGYQPLDADLTTLAGAGIPVPVAQGGTGATTLTDGGVLLGSGTGAITPMGVLADGAFIVGDGTTDPVAESGATARTSLGLGSLATQSGTFSGTSSGTNTGDQTITLSGDASGTGSGAITVVVADNSHAHGSQAVAGDVTGTIGATVVGDDSHVHSTSTLTGQSGTNSGDQTITLTGDVTGSGTGSFAATVGDNTHNHSISTITDEGSTALGGDLSGTAGAAVVGDNSHAHTSTVTLSGDVTGAGNATVVGDNSHGHNQTTVSNAADSDLLNGASETDAPTANTIVKRDASGRFAAADPIASDDVATMGWVEANAGGASHIRFAGDVNGNTGPGGGFTWAQCILVIAGWIDDSNNVSRHWFTDTSGSNPARFFYDIQEQCSDGVCDADYFIFNGNFLCYD